MPQTTVALVATEANAVLRLETVELDKLRPEEALVEIHAVGICHADISCLNGTIPVKFPNVFGHEGLYSRLPNPI
jgi:Zn-dependent alcohol dehydrogenase